MSCSCGRRCPANGSRRPRPPLPPAGGWRWRRPRAGPGRGGPAAGFGGMGMRDPERGVLGGLWSAGGCARPSLKSEPPQLPRPGVAAAAQGHRRDEGRKFGPFWGEKPRNDVAGPVPAELGSHGAAGGSRRPPGMALQHLSTPEGRPEGSRSAPRVPPRPAWAGDPSAGCLSCPGGRPSQEC